MDDEPDFSGLAILLWFVLIYAVIVWLGILLVGWAV